MLSERLSAFSFTIENGNLIRIQDQNAVTVGEEKTPMLCITSDKTKDQQTQEDFDALYAEAQWMKDAGNPGLNYIYERLVDMTKEEDDIDKCDMSDAGMMLYLLDGLTENNYATLKEWYAEHNFLDADERIDKSLTKEQLNNDVLEVAYLDTIEATDTVQLPETVTVTLGDNKTTAEVPVQWETTDFTEEGTYVVKGTLLPTDNITNTKNHYAYQVVNVTAK